MEKLGIGQRRPPNASTVMDASRGADTGLKNPCFSDGSVDDIEPSPPNLKASNAAVTIKFHADHDFSSLWPGGPSA
jgi:hypothetical protein